jgi:hypothetical protein
MNFGLIKSNLVGDERHFYTTQPVGRQYSHRIDEIYNQGSDPICAACAVCTFLKWRFPDKNWDPWVLFREAGGNSQGISYKELLQYLRKKGIIQEYALIHSEQALKTAIRVNGPCLGALNVYNSNNCNFWEGTRLEGGHGISLTGWRDDDFIIQNSWGEDWCKQGATLLPSNRFNLLIEMWTIIA